MAAQELPGEALHVAPSDLAAGLKPDLPLPDAVAGAGQQRVARALDQVRAVAAGVPRDFPVGRTIGQE